MNIDWLLVALRAVHVLSGVFWAGSAFVLAGFIVWPPANMSDEDGKFLGRLMLERRLSFFVVGASVFTIGSGGALYHKFYMDSSWNWSQPDPALVFGVGAIASIVAMAFMIGAGIPVGIRLRRLRREIDAGGGATPAQIVAHNHLIRWNVAVWRLTSALLGITVLSMATARYL